MSEMTSSISKKRLDSNQTSAKIFAVRDYRHGLFFTNVHYGVKVKRVTRKLIFEVVWMICLLSS